VVTPYMYACDNIKESQNHRMFGVGRDLCRSPSPTPLPKQGHLEWKHLLKSRARASAAVCVCSMGLHLAGCGKVCSGAGSEM